MADAGVDAGQSLSSPPLYVPEAERALHMKRLDNFLDPVPRPGYLRLRTQAFSAPFFLLICMIFMAFALNFTHERMPDPQRWKQLPDVGFDILPRTTVLEHATDLLLWTLNILNVLVVLGLYVVHTREEQRLCAVIRGEPEPAGVAFDETSIHGKIWSRLAPLLLYTFDAAAKAGRSNGLTPPDIDEHTDEFGDPVVPPSTATMSEAELRALEWRQLIPRHITNEVVTVLNVHLIGWIRFWCTFAVMTIARSFVIVMTVLPATNNHCQNPPEIKNIWLNALLAIVTFGSGSVHCGDLLFSGHTATITVTFMSVWTYGRLINWLFRPIALFCVSVSWVTIIASRSHYTDDVIIAFYCSVFTYIATRHDTQRGAPFWIQMFLYVIQIPRRLCREKEETVAEVVRYENEMSDTSTAEPPHAVVSVSSPVPPAKQQDQQSHLPRE